MLCRPIISCLLNYIAKNVQVTEGRMRPAGRMLVTPDLYKGVSKSSETGPID